MVRRLSPVSAIEQAKRVANENNCYVVEKSTPRGLIFLLYRRQVSSGQCSCCLERRSDAVAFFRFVDAVCSSA